MRLPRPSDVVDAVEYVSGAGVVGSRTERAQSVALAAHCLAEICDLNQSAIGRVLHMDRTTARYHLKKEPDLAAMAMVIQRVSDRLEAEDLDAAKERTERALAKEMML